MYLIAAICFLAVLALCGAADLLQAQISPEERNQMGIYER